MTVSRRQFVEYVAVTAAMLQAGTVTIPTATPEQLISVETIFDDRGRIEQLLFHTATAPRYFTLPRPVTIAAGDVIALRFDRTRRTAAVVVNGTPIDAVRVSEV